MICKKCGKEIPDLSMYCPECGAPQFAREEKEVNLVMPDRMKSKVVIYSCSNMTKGIQTIRAFTGLSIPEARKVLSSFPSVLLESLPADEAERSAEMLREEGLDAKAVHPDDNNKPEEPKPEEPKPAEPVPETKPADDFDAQMNAFLNEPKEEPKEETPAEPAGIQLTLEPSIRTDEEFMKEMEEFLNGK